MLGKDCMIDVVDKSTRSRMMAGIKGKNTKPEITLRHGLHRLGFRYRLHASGLPGRPDIVLPRHRAAIQVQGCFWHRHENCSFATMPASNTAFWNTKFGETIERDQRNHDALRKLDWRVAVVWECSIRKHGGENIAREIAAWLSSQRSFQEIPKLGKSKSRSKTA
jgi:DNA mismatch endonuclease (patch repair protein)